MTTEAISKVFIEVELLTISDFSRRIVVGCDQLKAATLTQGILHWYKEYGHPAFVSIKDGWRWCKFNARRLMRTLDIWFLYPRGRERQKLDLLALIQLEAEIRLDAYKNQGLPDRDAINRILGRGSGDDGFFPMTWEPFTIDESEYDDLRRQFKFASGRSNHNHGERSR